MAYIVMAYVVMADTESLFWLTAYRDRGDRRGGIFRVNFDRQDMDFLGMATRNSARTDASGHMAKMLASRGRRRDQVDNQHFSNSAFQITT